MGLSIRTKNILTAVIALVLVGGFIFLAEGRKKDNKDDRLEAIEGLTTTTVRRTTTTRRETTTSSTALVTTSTSSSPAVTTATTVRTTTSSTAASSKPKPTTTTRPSAPAPNGVRPEASDNGNSFTRNSDGSFATSAAPQCKENDLSDSFCFHVGSEGNFALVVILRNNTNRTLKFPTQDKLMRLIVNVQRPNGTTQQFSLDTRKLGQEIAPFEGIRITTEDPQKLAGQFTDVGQYTFTASCEVDYGT